MNLLRTIIAGALLIFVIAGCDSEEAKTYDMSITWTIGGGPDCSASVNGEMVNFSSVEINLYETEEEALAKENPYETETAMCDLNAFTISRLKRNTYWVTVDAMGVIAGESLPLYSDTKKVGVPVKDDEAVDFTLIQNRSRILVEWGFKSGRVCGVTSANEVAEIEIVSAKNVTVPCAEGSYLFTDVVPDSYSLTMNALDENGDVLYTTSVEDPFTVLPGQTYEAFLIFD